ncbi:MAG: pyrroline-5-carboxylate reductase, partial [Methylomonas sp.]
MNTRTIGFIGGGNMATSLMSGLIASGHSAQQIWVSDTQHVTLQTHRDELKVNTSEDNSKVAAESDVVVLAVKPKFMREVTMAIAPAVQQRRPLIVSIAAGISQASLSAWLGADSAIVRC